jgi:hypothetical protein
MLLLEYVIYVEKGFFHKVTDKVEGLYLDANSIIHVATQYLEFDGLSPVKMEQCCQLVVFLIRTIVNHYKPRGVLYIAVDGVVPMTKIQQQRERRYESAMTTKSLEYTGSFITPGTLFMQALNEHLIQFVDDKGSLDMHVDVVIYSSYLVPGEGEHKIMDYIRSRSLKPENGANVIFGNDADLILLALGNDSPNLYVADNTVVLKTNRTDIEEFILPPIKQQGEISIGNLRHGLRMILAEENVDSFIETYLPIKRVGDYDRIMEVLTRIIGEDKSRKLLNTQVDNIKQTKETRDKIKYALIELFGEVYIRDFIFLSSLMGNDFLPRSPIFADIGDDILFLINLIKAQAGVLSPKGLMKDPVGLFKQLAERETFRLKTPVSLGALQDKCLNGVITTSGSVKFRSYPSPIIQALSGVAEEDKDKMFRSFWYTKCFRTNATEEYLQTLGNMCTSYIRGMYWVYNYYIHGQDQVTWLWYYPYWYAPLFKDLHATVKAHKVIQKFDTIAQVNPVLNENRFTVAHQLISVMPWQVSRYVPEPLLIRVYSSVSPFNHLLPLAVILDTEFAEVKHQSKVLVPYVGFYEVMHRLATIQFAPTFVRSFDGKIRKNMETPKAKDRQRRNDQYKTRQKVKSDMPKFKPSTEISKTIRGPTPGILYPKQKDEPSFQTKRPTFGSKVVPGNKPTLSEPPSKGGLSAAAANRARQLQNLSKDKST